jgi:DNA-binding transcriptional ArsR family regulator
VPPDRPYATLAANLEALASETRLALLHALRLPRAVNDIRLSPLTVRPGENPDRALTRQAVTRHLEQLQDAGLVQRVADPGSRADLYVLNHERLFALVDELRRLAKLRTAHSDDLGGVTMDATPQASEPLPTGPRLYMAYGRDDGLAFPLQGPKGTRWVIGRGKECAIRLDYDPYLSTRSAAVERTEAGFVLHDLQSRNGSWVNGAKLPRGGTRDLAPGDALTVGRSVLVFQPGSLAP